MWLTPAWNAHGNWSLLWHTSAACGGCPDKQGVVGELDENNVLAIKAAEAVREQRQGHNNNFNAHIPSDIARARLHPTPASPSLSTRSASPLLSSSNNSSSSGGPHGNGAGPGPQAVAPSRDFGQVSITMTPPSPLPQRHSNHHQHHLNHQPFQQRQNVYANPHPHPHSQQQQQQSHYHSHAPPPLSVVSHPPMHGQHSPSDFRSFHPAGPSSHLYERSIDEFPPPPAPLALVEEEELSPPVTPPTPLAPLAQQVMCVTGSLEDEFTRVSAFVLHRALSFCSLCLSICRCWRGCPAIAVVIVVMILLCVGAN